ncbi:MAG TPA: hypothetical protein VLD58_08925 [Gemmatimonadales bacterium]|nr:hypothetical protein [Gemmatimonadales bacterium]
MSAGARYLVGTAVIALAAMAAGAVVPGSWRPGWWLALGIALVVQAPLGWWLMRSIGTERFLAVWVLGILARLVTVGLTGLVIVPALGWPAAPALLALAGFLVASLALEGVVSALQHSRAPVR